MYRRHSNEINKTWESVTLKVRKIFVLYVGNFIGRQRVACDCDRKSSLALKIERVDFNSKIFNFLPPFFPLQNSAQKNRNLCILGVDWPRVTFCP